MVLLTCVCVRGILGVDGKNQICRGTQSVKESFFIGPRPTAERNWKYTVVESAPTDAWGPQGKQLRVGVRDSAVWQGNGETRMMVQWVSQINCANHDVPLFQDMVP